MTNIIHAGKNAAANTMWQEMLSDFSEVAENSSVAVVEEKEEFVKIAVRGRGKVHPATMHNLYGIMISCSCPGSHNGSLEKVVRKVADGWDLVNCGN